MDVVPVLATKEAITKAIGKCYSMQNTGAILDSVTSQFADDDLNSIDDESADRIDNAPIVKLATLSLKTRSVQAQRISISSRSRPLPGSVSE